MKSLNKAIRKIASIKTMTPILALEILDLNKKYTLPELKESYKRLIFKHHPDRNQGNIMAEEKATNINMAFELLKKMLEKKSKRKNESVIKDIYDEARITKDYIKEMWDYFLA
ncbi:MAG: DnaJ domain-containing protein [Bacteroidia bacterium]